MCPVESVSEYLTARPTKDGPFLCHFSGPHFTRFQFSAMLIKSLKYAGIESSKYKAHSFRTGTATALSICRVPHRRNKKSWQMEIHFLQIIYSTSSNSYSKTFDKYTNYQSFQGFRQFGF